IRKKGTTGGPWSSSFQRHQIGDNIRLLGETEYLVVRGHRRSLQYLVVANVALEERAQPCLIIDDLNAVSVLVESTAIHDVAVLQLQAYGTIDRKHDRGGIQKRFAQSAPRPESTYVRQVWTDIRSPSVHPMALLTLAFSFEQSLTTGSISN